MNIFVLDNDVQKAAQYHVDKHVVKMPLETAQILSSALRLNGVDSNDLYRLTHKHHPCVKWAASNRDNFNWLCKFGYQICNEYTYRYGKLHKSFDVICRAEGLQDYINHLGIMTQHPKAMPQKYNVGDVVESYRQYYINEKRHLANWKKRDKPDWWK